MRELSLSFRAWINMKVTVGSGRGVREMAWVNGFVSLGARRSGEVLAEITGMPPSSCMRHMSIDLPGWRPHVRIKAVNPRRRVSDNRGMVPATRTSAIAVLSLCRSTPRSWFQLRPESAIIIRRGQRWGRIHSVVIRCFASPVNLYSMVHLHHPYRRGYRGAQTSRNAGGC